MGKTHGKKVPFFVSWISKAVWCVLLIKFRDGFFSDFDL